MPAAAQLTAARVHRRPPLPPANRLLAAVALTAAVLNGLVALAFTPAARFELSDPSTLIDDRLWAGLVAAVLVPLGWGILRRRRGAWLCLLGLAGGVLELDLLLEQPPVELAAPALALVVLLVARDRLVAEPFRQSLRSRCVPTRAALARAQPLLAAHGCDAMAPFKLRTDVGHLFSRRGDAFLAFRVENRSLMVAADPVGTDAGVSEVIEQARGLARRAGLRFGVLAASPQLAERLRTDHSMRPIYLGCEAIVRADAFTLEGRAVRKVRQACTRVERAGFALECVRLADLGPQERRQLKACQARARTEVPESPSFAMAPEALLAPGTERAIVVRARHRETDAVTGFLVLLPLAQRSLWTLGLQLRDPDAPSGVTDALVACALLHARAEGVQELSLNFAAARRYMHEPVAGLWPRAARVLARLATHVTQIDTLRAYNEKFSPQWEPRYAVVDHWLEVPHLLMAVIWLEGQLPRPTRWLHPAWPAGLPGR